MSTFPKTIRLSCTYCTASPVDCNHFQVWREEEGIIDIKIRFKPKVWYETWQNLKKLMDQHNTIGLAAQPLASRNAAAGQAYTGIRDYKHPLNIAIKDAFNSVLDVYDDNMCGGYPGSCSSSGKPLSKINSLFMMDAWDQPFKVLRVAQIGPEVYWEGTVALYQFIITARLTGDPRQHGSTGPLAGQVISWV